MKTRNECECQARNPKLIRKLHSLKTKLGCLNWLQQSFTNSPSASVIVSPLQGGREFVRPGKRKFREEGSDLGTVDWLFFHSYTAF